MSRKNRTIHHDIIEKMIKEQEIFGQFTRKKKGKLWNNLKNM